VTRPKSTAKPPWHADFGCRGPFQHRTLVRQSGRLHLRGTPLCSRIESSGPAEGCTSRRVYTFGVSTQSAAISTLGAVKDRGRSSDTESEASGGRELYEEPSITGGLGRRPSAGSASPYSRYCLFSSTCPPLSGPADCEKQKIH
jgi:hypothetical protein